MNHVRVISNLHRIQASPGYREAAHYCVDRLTQYGLQAELVTYPAQPDVYFGNWRSFPEWRCQEGELLLLEPTEKRLARYTEMELSIIQRSTATPPEGVTTELVLVENAEEESGYEGIDVRGKIVLARGNQMRIAKLAIEQYGALGLVLDNMTSIPPLRTRADLYDAVQYTSFWWFDEAVTGFGFAVSPRVGDELRDLCRKGPVRVFARVEAELLAGEMENVEAFIPGETDEEVLLVSHLCHPKPGGNDNATGPSTLLETARTLNRLIQQGKIAKPRRGLRFLLMPEMTGTHAYLHLHPERIGKTVAALNLDMVGADQTKSGGPLTVTKNPRALPSYTSELVYGIFSEVAQDVGTFSGSFRYSLTNHVFTPFSGGSDHYILTDPSVGIPCPMMITWPDKFYHTSADTTENIDPQLMEKVATTAATYLYWIANAGLDDLSALASRLTMQFSGEVEQLFSHVGDGVIPASQAHAHLLFLKDCKIADLNSLQTLVPSTGQDAWQELIDQRISFIEQAHALHLTELTLRFTHDGADEQAESDASTEMEMNDPLLDQVFVRTHRGPIDLMGFVPLLEAHEQERWHRTQKQAQIGHEFTSFLQYWMDGSRPLREVIRLTELESGLKNVAYTLDYVRLLLRLNLITAVQ